VLVAGVLTFALVYGLLTLVPRSQAPEEDETPRTRAADSFATRIASTELGVALPVGTAEALLRGLQAGDRLNVVARVADPQTGRPLTAVVCRGATVVQPTTGSDPVLVQVAPKDAIVLAHLVLGGTPLSYVAWPGGVPPAEVPSVDEETARRVLGLPAPTTLPTVVIPAPPTPTPPGALFPPTPIPPTAVPTAVPAPEPARPGPADRYVVHDGETLASIATQLGLNPEALRGANPDVKQGLNDVLPPGMQLVVPQ
jgi:hypothetical protein